MFLVLFFLFLGHGLKWQWSDLMESMKRTDSLPLIFLKSLQNTSCTFPVVIHSAFLQNEVKWPYTQAHILIRLLCFLKRMLTLPFSHWPSVFLLSGCNHRNTMDWYKQQICIIIVLEAGSPRSGYQHGWLKALFQVTDFSLYPYIKEGTWNLSGVLFHKGTNPFPLIASHTPHLLMSSLL